MKILLNESHHLILNYLKNIKIMVLDRNLMGKIIFHFYKALRITVTLKSPIHNSRSMAPFL